VKTDDLVTIAQLARMLKVDIRWLRKETRAGRIPHLSTGRDTLFNPVTVREVLARRAQEIKPKAPKRQTFLSGGAE